MWRIHFKNLVAHRRRMASTVVAIILGVAFLTGTMVLGDTMSGGFDRVFTAANQGIDVVVRNSTVVGTDDSEQRGRVDATLATDLEKIDGVDRAGAQLLGTAQIIGSDGQPLGGDGPPTLSSGWISDTALNPYRLTEGREPQASGEVVIDAGAATTAKLALGASTSVLTPDRVSVTVVGIATFSGGSGTGGLTFVWFTPDQAQELLGQGLDGVSSVLIVGDGTVSADVLAERVSAALPAGVEAITGTELTQQQIQGINGDFLDFLRIFLVMFSVVAMLVATFSIYNTFSMLTAQRTREAALLRAIGSTRAQVLRSVMAETTAIAVIASGLGVLAGLGLATGLKALLLALGSELPTSGLDVTATTLIIAFSAGMISTLVAGAVPALSASRIPPLAAIRDVAIERVSAGRFRSIAGSVLMGSGLAALVIPTVAGWTSQLWWVGGGSGALIVAMVLLGPVVARPISSLIGRPIESFARISGHLARNNATRSPRRTASTAAALMVGVGVVTVFMVLGSSIASSIDNAVTGSLRADLIIGGDGTSSAGLSAELEGRVGSISGVQQSTSLGRGAVNVGNESVDLTVFAVAGVDRLIDFGATQGSVGELRQNQIAVSKEFAADRQLSIGSTLPATFADSSTTTAEVGAIYSNGELVGDVLMPDGTWAGHGSAATMTTLLVRIEDGSDLDAVQAQVNSVATELGAPASKTRGQFADDVAGELSQVMNTVYVLLALSVVIALMGIANTLALSVRERTREIGLLRAVGMTRSQTRAMVRWESVIIAIFGTLGGIGLGIGCGWALVRAAAADQGIGSFSAPYGQLAIVIIAGALAGILAARRPARQAARLDVLSAISGG